MHAFVFYLFFLAFSTTTLAEFLTDTDGHVIYNVGWYYITPAGGGGGLELAKTGNQTCPLTVVQAHSETSRGLPARLSSPDNIHQFTTEFPLYINFAAPYSCAPSPSWWTIDGKTQAVKITGKPNQQVGPFRIWKYGHDYKIDYCTIYHEPQVRLRCKDLGISNDDKNNKRLVVKEGDPFVIQFVKADHKKGDFAEMNIA